MGRMVPNMLHLCRLLPSSNRILAIDVTPKRVLQPVLSILCADWLSLTAFAYTKSCFVYLIVQQQKSLPMIPITFALIAASYREWRQEKTKQKEKRYALHGTIVNTFAV